MINGRNKGNAYERKIVRELKEIGFTDAVTSRSESKNADDAGVDILNTGGWAIQCKAVERGLNLFDAMSHISRKYGTPVTFWKKNRKPELVVMYKEDFYNLITDCLLLDTKNNT
jgi:Holliday junction resolvase